MEAINDLWCLSCYCFPSPFNHRATSCICSNVFSPQSVCGSQTSLLSAPDAFTKLDDELSAAMSHSKSLQSISSTGGYDVRTSPDKMAAAVPGLTELQQKSLTGYLFFKLII